MFGIKIPVIFDQPIGTEITNSPTVAVRPLIPETLFYYVGDAIHPGFNISIPPGEMWLIQWVWMSYSANNTSTPRNIRMYVVDAMNREVARYSAQYQQPINTTAIYHFMNGCPYTGFNAAVSTHYIPTGELLLPSNYQIALGDFTNLDPLDLRTVAVVGTRIPTTL